MSIRDEISASIQRLEEMLDSLPEPAARDLRRKIKELRELLLEQRPARFVVVGRRGSGKSSLVNAIFGAPVAEVGHERAQTGKPNWETYTGSRGSLRLLDTRGLQEGSAPVEETAADSPVAEILAELTRTPPDAILFLVKAKEADSAIDGDLDGLDEVRASIHKIHGYNAPVVAVLTQCDELEPKSVGLHDQDGEDPEDLEEKLNRVGRLEAQLQAKIRERSSLKDNLVAVIGVCAYQSWRRDGTPRADERWRIDELLDFLFLELPDEARVEFVRLSQVAGIQRQIARTLTKVTAALCAGLAATPIPVADIIPITSAQVSLIVGIGYVAGRDMDYKAATEFLVGIGANVGLAYGMREIARAVGKFIFPGAGNMVSAAVAFGGTIGIGRAAEAYFIDEKSLEDAAAVFRREKASAEREADS